MTRAILPLILLLLTTICSIPVLAAYIGYTYDDLNRLTKVDYGQGVYISFMYDEIGNITNVVANGDPIELGDINGDGSVDLEDVIEGLKTVNNQPTASDWDNASDVNGDGKLGLEEVLHALQAVKGGQ